MKRVVIIVKGKVQKVGYRDWVEDIALDTSITGYVENLKPYKVRIVCEGEKENLEKFIDLIKIEDYPIFVKDMNIEYKEPTGEFEYFEIKRGDWQEELGERMDVAARVMYATMKNTSQSLKIGERMLGKQDQTLGKQDQMIDKQDQTLGKQDQMLGKQDQMLGKQDQMLGKQDQTTGSIENLRGDMGERFDILDDKYGAINRNLLKVIEKIEYLLEKSDRDREANSKTMERLLNELIDARKNGSS